MHELPSGCAVRTATEEDLAAIGDLLLAHDRRHGQVTTIDADFVRFQWSTEGFDPTNDTWLVERDGVVIGYALTLPEGPERVRSWGLVHPDHLGSGIGSTLFGLIESPARERLASATDPILDHAIDTVDRAAADLVRAREFEHVRSFRHMHIDLEDPIDPGERPPGIEIRALDANRDLRAVHAIMVEAFRQEWRYRVVPFDEWFEQEVSTPSADLDFWLVATAGDRPVGALTGFLWSGGGWIGELGVLPEHRGRGIASTLLRRSFAAFASRGLPHARLNVDAANPTDAVRLYERAGMRAVRSWELYERRL